MSSGPPGMPMGPRPIITPGSMVNNTFNSSTTNSALRPPATTTNTGVSHPPSSSIPNNNNTVNRSLPAPLTSTGVANNLTVPRPMGISNPQVLMPPLSSNSNVPRGIPLPATTTTPTTTTVPTNVPVTTSTTNTLVNKGPVPTLTTFPPRTTLPSSSSLAVTNGVVRPPLSMGVGPMIGNNNNNNASSNTNTGPTTTTTVATTTPSLLTRPPLTTLPSTTGNPSTTSIAPPLTNTVPLSTTSTNNNNNKPATQVVSTASMFGPAPTNAPAPVPVVSNNVPVPNVSSNGLAKPVSNVPLPSTNGVGRPPLTTTVSSSSVQPITNTILIVRPPLTTIGTGALPNNANTMSNSPSTTASLNPPRPLGINPVTTSSLPSSLGTVRPPLTSVPNITTNTTFAPNTASIPTNVVPSIGSGPASLVRPPFTSNPLSGPSSSIPQPITVNNGMPPMTKTTTTGPPLANNLPRPNLLQPPVSAVLGGPPRGTMPPVNTTTPSGVPLSQPVTANMPPPLSSLPGVRPLVPPTTLGNTNAPPLTNISGPPLPNLARGPPTLPGNPAVPFSQQSSNLLSQPRPMMNGGPPLPQLPGNLNQQPPQQQYNGPPTSLGGNMQQQPPFPPSQSFNPSQAPFPPSQQQQQAQFSQPPQQQPQQSMQQGQTSQYSGAPQISTASPSKLGSGIPSSSASQRIDPNQIPRPRYTNPSNSTRYNTLDSQASVPPPAWSDFVAEDTGNSNPRFIRSTIGHVPIAKDILKEAKLPFAVMVTPLAAVHSEERGVPLIDFGEDGPIRCSRCKGYINPWVKWTLGDGGRTWNCNLCGMINETPGWYVPMSGVDQYGLRRDRTERFELSMGSIDMIAPKSYLLRPTAPLCVAFVVDVSLPAITSGLFTTVLTAINASLDTLLHVSNGTARVGIITYDSVLHFYDLDPSRREISIAHAGDVDDAFCPLALDQWCPSIQKARTQIESLITRLPTMFPPTIARSGASCTSAAIKAAVDGLSGTGGRVVSYAMQLPLIGEGKLGNRELAKNYGIDKEREMYIPAAGNAGAWYADLAKTASSNGVCIDIASCTPNFMDLPTYATLTIRTGGDVQQYPYFTPTNIVPAMNQLAPINPISEEVQEKIIQELNNKFSRELGIEAVLKVRTSPGLRVGKYLGNFEERRENEADMAGIDSEKSILVTLQHDGNSIKENEELYVQAALLYTTTAGQRRVRVHNLRLIASDSVQSVFRHADVDAIISYLVRTSVQTTITLDVRTVMKDLIDAAIEMLYSYRRHCASNSSPGQLILPESLKLLPLYLAVILKLPAFTVNKPPSKGMMTLNEVTTRVDTRIVELSALSCMPASRLVPYMYPRLYRIDLLSQSHAVVLPLNNEIMYGPDGQPLETPPPPPKIATSILPEEFPRVLLPQVIYPSVEQIAPHASYLLEHRNGLFLIIGSDSDEDTFHELFGNGIPNPQALPPGTPLPMLDTDASMRVWTIIYTLRSRRLPYLPVHVIAPSDTMGKNMVNNLLVEDRVGNVRSYVDLLCHVHSEIQSKLTKL